MNICDILDQWQEKSTVHFTNNHLNDYSQCTFLWQNMCNESGYNKLINMDSAWRCMSNNIHSMNALL